MKITVKLWLYMAIIVILVLALVWVFLIMLLPDTYFENANSRLNSLAAEAVAVIGTDDPAGLGEEKQEKIRALCEKNELRIELFSPLGETQGFFGWGRSFTPLTSADFALLVNGQYVSKRVARAGFSETLITAHPLFNDSRLVSILTASLPIAPVEDTLDILAEQLIFVIVASLIVSMGVAFLLSRSFVRPIREMEQAALKIAQGEHYVPVHLRDHSEIGDLSRTLNRMSSQLQQVESMRQQFIATVSHQFKTPLSIIQGHTELIADTLSPEIAARYAVQFSNISDEIFKLDRMARDMMRLSGYQASAVSPSRSDVNLYKLCCHLSARLTILNDSRLEIAVPEDMTVYSNEDSLSDVLENLLGNAIKHAKASKIEIIAEMEQASPDARPAALIRVKDNGVGLTPEQQEHIWERFYKGDLSDRNGNGLGMAIVKAILEALGAEYGIVVDNGTEIWFRLPPAE